MFVNTQRDELWAAVQPPCGMPSEAALCVLAELERQKRKEKKRDSSLTTAQTTGWTCHCLWRCNWCSGQWGQALPAAGEAGGKDEPGSAAGAGVGEAYKSHWCNTSLWSGRIHRQCSFVTYKEDTEQEGWRWIWLKIEKTSNNNRTWIIKLDCCCCCCEIS